MGATCATRSISVLSLRRAASAAAMSLESLLEARLTAAATAATGAVFSILVLCAAVAVPRAFVSADNVDSSFTGV